MILYAHSIPPTVYGVKNLSNALEFRQLKVGQILRIRSTKGTFTNFVFRILAVTDNGRGVLTQSWLRIDVRSLTTKKRRDQIKFDLLQPVVLKLIDLGGRPLSKVGVNEFFISSTNVLAPGCAVFLGQDGNLITAP